MKFEVLAAALKSDSGMQRGAICPGSGKAEGQACHKTSYDCALATRVPLSGTMQPLHWQNLVRRSRAGIIPCERP